MQVAFYWHDSPPDTLMLGPLKESIERDGHRVDVIPKSRFSPESVSRYDAVFTRGVSDSRPIMDACFEKAVNVVYCDKSYTHRGWRSFHANAYFRFSVNGFHPLAYFQSVPRPPDRWEKLGIPLKPLRGQGEHILFAGCSQKFASWHDFDITEYATAVIRQIQKFTDRPIVYRPKRSSVRPPPIPGTVYSHGKRKIEHELTNAHALVTFSSNAAADAVFAGVPAFVLGPSIARPVSNTDLSKIESPGFPTERERYQWCCDLAYCQWRLNELENVWLELKETMKRLERKPASMPG